MRQGTGSFTAPAVLEKDCFVPELNITPRPLHAILRDPPPSAWPRLVSLQGRKCPQCHERLGGPAELRVLDGVVQALCRGRGCGFGVDLFWVPACWEDAH